MLSNTTQAILTHINSSNMEIHLEIEALQVDYKQQRFEDLQTQLNNSNSLIKSQQSRTEQQVGILQSMLTNSNQDIQSQLNESIVA